LKAAVEAVRDHQVSTRKAAEAFKIPRRTLRRYLDDEVKAVGTPADVGIRMALGVGTTLPKDLEDILASYCLDLCNR
jgi:predicted DNA-binding transcriptional regulator YafY